MLSPLNPFESLLFLEHMAPFILRLPLAFFLLSGAFAYWKRAQAEKHRPILYVVAVVEALIGFSIGLGYYTQLGALAGLLYLITIWIFKKSHPSLVQFPQSFYILAAAIFISLLLTGSGAFAFDLPL